MKILSATVLIALMGFVSLVSLASAEVLVFDRYDTVSKVEGNSIIIEREMVLTNVARNPIIPGELHFKLYRQDGNNRVPIEVDNFVAYNERGQSLSTKIITRTDETDLAVTVWDPLLPGFSYTFRVSYEMKFEPTGLLFYQLNIPREDTTIPIKQSKQTVQLEQGYHVTYAPDAQISRLSGNAVVSWAGQSEVQTIEYSSLPLPRVRLGSISVKAVNLFWGVVIACLVGLFAFSLNRQKKLKEEAELAELEAQHSSKQQHQARPPNHPGHPPNQPPQGPSGG